MTLIIDDLTKRHPSGRGIFGISLRAGAGEIVALIGPSGCGKTTLLRTVAGLSAADSGRVILRDRDVTTLPPERRNVGLIFQSYALFPHLSVFENVAYGLRARGAHKASIGPAVGRALAIVDLAQRDGRIDQLSGGEQQRVAVARAIVTEPDLLLLDEPLSNLDPNLRHRMRQGLRGILKKLAIPSIHVTHDQEEALAIADQVAVFDAGRLAQIGTPQDVYRRPASAFVARFIGNANILGGEVVSAVPGHVTVSVPGCGTLEASSAAPCRAGDPVDVAIRPETVRIATHSERQEIEATVAEVAFLGAAVEVRCAAAGAPFVARIPSHVNGASASPGDRLRFGIDPANVHVMPRSP